MREYAALILAAGKGTRMKSGLCKVLHPIAGRPMLLYVLDAVTGSGCTEIAAVVGHQAEDVRRLVEPLGVGCALQEPQLGTGHAVSAARRSFDGFEGDILILAGDVPLIGAGTLKALFNSHRDKGSALSVLTFVPPDAFGYGRIVRDTAGDVAAIVEEKDATEEQRAIREVNSGIYLVDAALLFDLVGRLADDNAQGEYYLTDIVAAAVKRTVPVHGVPAPDAREVCGVNTREELAIASKVVWERLRRELMLSGVTLWDPDTVYIDYGVTVGADTVIHPGVTLCGNVTIGSECIIEPGVLIKDSTISDRVKVLLGSRIDSSFIDAGTQVGPMAHVRPESRIGRNARIGNFVEVKKTVVGDGTKASHLTYLGDSTIGRDANIGCGTITCNYDGVKKHPTIIGDRCFVGSDVQFVAPVEIGEGSLIGAGSTITRDVPPNTLAVTRAKQKMYPLRKGQFPRGNKDEDPKS
ncbi:MAG: bifunctional UDP-N-acetylglucosamine diphosphorylase/glucosamine-1-phosphate N-acetyltransferase GlmU [Pseudomonadota bacterium]